MNAERVHSLRKTLRRLQALCLVAGALTLCGGTSGCSDGTSVCPCSPDGGGPGSGLVTCSANADVMIGCVGPAAGNAPCQATRACTCQTKSYTNIKMAYCLCYP